MKLRAILIIFLSTTNIIATYAADYGLNGYSWQKDGRSIGLGGGMNAIDQKSLNGISINYLLPYHLSELSTRSIKICQQTKWLKMEGLWSQAGDAIFMENYFALGASRYLSGSFMLGIKAGFYRYAMITGDKGSTLISELNCKYKPYEKMQITVYLFNPMGAKIKRGNDQITMYQSFHLGVSYYPTNKIEGLLEMEKTQQEAIIWHLGLEYAIMEKFFIRTGLSTPPLRPSWGIGGNIHRFKYAIGGNIHPVLGFSSCFSFYYSW